MIFPRCAETPGQRPGESAAPHGGAVVYPRQTKRRLRTYRQPRSRASLPWRFRGRCGHQVVETMRGINDSSLDHRHHRRHWQHRFQTQHPGATPPWKRPAPNKARGLPWWPTRTGLAGRSAEAATQRLQTLISASVESGARRPWWTRPHHHERSGRKATSSASPTSWARSAQPAHEQSQVPRVAMPYPKMDQTTQQNAALGEMAAAAMQPQIWQAQGDLVQVVAMPSRSTRTGS